MLERFKTWENLEKVNLARFFHLGRCKKTSWEGSHGRMQCTVNQNGGMVGRVNQKSEFNFSFPSCNDIGNDSLIAIFFL